MARRDPAGGAHRMVLAQSRAWYRFAEGGAMRLAVYGVVLVSALGSVLLGLDWLSAPMPPMVDTKAELRAALPPAPLVPSATVTAPVTPPAPATPAASARPPITAPAPPTPRANIGAPIVSPGLTPSPPTSAGTAAQATTDAPAVAREPQVRCNVDACSAAYRSFTASDCTYQPSNGPRRLCAK